MSKRLFVNLPSLPDTAASLRPDFLCQFQCLPVSVPNFVCRDVPRRSKSQTSHVQQNLDAVASSELIDTQGPYDVSLLRETSMKTMTSTTRLLVGWCAVGLVGKKTSDPHPPSRYIRVWAEAEQLLTYGLCDCNYCVGG